MMPSIKFLMPLFVFCISCGIARAQQKHFIYVESENKQPFAVVLNGKVYSSSDYGYVIIPKLTDGDYNFTVSFPMNKFPDQNFSCIINKKDAGYILKSSTNGWALENMQSQKAATNTVAAVAQNNAFGNMLSDAVSDSNLTKTNFQTQPPPDTAVNAAAGSIEATDAAASSITVTDATALNNTALTNSSGKPEKIAEQKLDTGTHMQFVDKTQNGIDTINVFVPSEQTNVNEMANSFVNTDAAPDSQNAASSPAEVPAINSTLQNASTDLSNASAGNNNTTDTSTHDVTNPFYTPEQNNNPAAITNSTETTQITTTTTGNAVRQDCAKMISDDDLNKLKRKMFSQNGDFNMIQYASKYLNNKCITTDQIKTLGNLFSSDDGRYTLYDALYKYTYDYGNYPVLANQILDPYYKKRFAAMLR